MDKMKFTGERYIPGEGSMDINIEHNIRYKFATQFVAGKNVLDIASGEGYGSDILAKTANSVIGIDISDDAVNCAKNKYIKENLEFMQGSIAKIPLDDNCVDVIISFETIEHVNEELQNAFMAEAKRVLKADGILIMSTPNRPIYTELFNQENEFHIKEFDKSEYLSFINKYFKNNVLISQSNEMVSFLASEEKQINANITNKFNINNAKYFISISSDIDIDENIQANAYIWEETEYTNRILRILELQDSVEELSKWGMSLDEELAEKNKYIQELLIDSNNLQNNCTLDTKTLENELEYNKNELNKIYSSRSWRYLGYIWNIRDKILPKDSRRRLIIKISIKAAKHPIAFIKKLTPSKIKKSISILKREGLAGISSRVDENVFSAPIPNINLNLLQRIKDINKADKLIFNKADNPIVSIIIPVYNQVEYTYNCLKSILNNTKNISIEIIIANDCSTDETLKLANICENINIITNKTNLRFLKNCNNAALSAKGKYILFLNNDTQVMEDWLEPLVDVIESDDNIGMVGSKLIYPDGRLQEAGGIIFSDGSGWNYGRLSNPSESEYNYVKEVDYISGAAIMIRSTLWNEIGGFDEHFAPAYYEDTDLAFAVRSKGKKVVFVPKSIVVHFEGVSNGTDTSSGQKSYQVINAEKFKEKWKNELTKNHFANGENIFLARDRSKNKKTILVIDHYVPTHDKDAGSKCTFMYIRLMAKMGYNVKFIGDNFARLQPYADDLQNLGVEILCGNYYMKNWKSYIKDNAQYIDFVYLNRPHISEKYIDFIKENTAAKIIYFGHDLHHVRLMREYELSKDESIKKDAIAWKDREYSLFNKSDSIFVVGSYEQKIVANDFKDKNVYNIPVYFYDKLKDGINQNFETRNNIIFVGGFNHSPNVDAVIWFKQNIFPKILEKHPNIKWYIVGSNPTEQVLNLASDNIIVTGFISDEELEALYLECRLAVVPLRFGAGVKGKVIEAIYHKIPLITTNIGAEGLSTKEDAMIICDNADDFAAEVNNLYNNFDRLKQLSNNCDDFIKNNFTENVARDIIIREFI